MARVEVYKRQAISMQSFKFKIPKHPNIQIQKCDNHLKITLDKVVNTLYERTSNPERMRVNSIVSAEILNRHTEVGIHCGERASRVLPSRPGKDFEPLISCSPFGWEKSLLKSVGREARRTAAKGGQVLIK
jgi:hypothetical protein